MTITRYRKGQLSVPLIYCPLIDTLSGDLVVRRAGGTRMEFRSTYNYSVDHLLLGPDKELRDSGGTALLAGDNSGNVDQLARIDCAVTSPVDSFDVHIKPSEGCPANQSGTLNELHGNWEIVANDVLYIWLGKYIPFQLLKGTVRIDEITINFRSDANGDYITDVALGHFLLGGTSFVSDWSDPTDKGNGTSGVDNATYDPALTLINQVPYQLKITATVPTTGLGIYIIGIKYSLV